MKCKRVPSWLLTVLLSLVFSVPAAHAAFDVENRSVVSGGVNRPFVIAIPNPRRPNLPLVISLHGDGGNGPDMRSALNLEAASNEGAVFVYPTAAGNIFTYFTDVGRAKEVQFVRELISALAAELSIDTGAVFIAGFSGGATMANALGCRMGTAEIRGLGIHSGSLYPINNDFTYTANGGVSCALPAAILIWGEADTTNGVSYSTGVSILANHRATQNCAATTLGNGPLPCVRYSGCGRPVNWCSIPAMGHSIWASAAPAMWQFFASQAPWQGFASGFENVVL